MRPVTHHPPALSRRRVIPLPDEYVDHLYLHPVLSNNAQPEFAWDLSLGPWTAALSQDRTHYAPATAPPTRNTIYIRVAAFPYCPIVVVPGATPTAKFITVWDVVLVTYRTIRSQALRSEGLFDLESSKRFLIPQIAHGGYGEEVRQVVYDRNEEQVTTTIREYLEDMTRWSGIRVVNAQENYYILELGHR